MEALLNHLPGVPSGTENHRKGTEGHAAAQRRKQRILGEAILSERTSKLVRRKSREIIIPPIRLVSNLHVRQEFERLPEPTLFGLIALVGQDEVEQLKLHAKSLADEKARQRGKGALQAAEEQ